MPLDLDEIFRSRDFVALRDKLYGFRPSELATMICNSEPHEQVILFRILPRKLAAANLPLERQQSLLSAMAQSEAAAIVNEMSPDDRTMLLEELPAEVTEELLTMLPAKERAVDGNAPLRKEIRLLARGIIACAPAASLLVFMFEPIEVQHYIRLPAKVALEPL